MKSQRVFITRGSSGRGRERARHYARADANVLIGDIDDGRGQALAAAYSAAKAAVVALSETRRLESARDNICVSPSCPGFFRTDLAKHMHASVAEFERYTKRLVERARIHPEEIARKITPGVARSGTHILTRAGSLTAWRKKRYVPNAWYLRRICRQLAKIGARMQQRKEVAA